VAAGQGAAFWMPKVGALTEEVARQIDDLRSVAASTNGRGLLMESAATVTEFSNVDRRVRDYIGSGQMLMAGDVVFTEGGETVRSAARQVEASRLAELQALDTSEATLRRREAMAIAGATAFSLLIMIVLSFASPRPSETAAAAEGTEVAAPAAGGLTLRVSRDGSASARPAERTSSAFATRGSAPMLKAAADLCTEFGRVNDRADLPRLMARAADVLDASGLVLWLGNPSGADLRPILAHGYPEHVLARMSTVARSADNAAAAAYRTGAMQIVLKRPGVSNGAVVAPLLSPEGCIGALTAEIIGGSETSDGVQAMAALLAAQLTGVVAGAVESSVQLHESPAERIASA
jgi:hypothetical protein